MEFTFFFSEGNAWEFSKEMFKYTFLIKNIDKIDGSLKKFSEESKKTLWDCIELKIPWGIIEEFQDDFSTQKKNLKKF